jgi:hypothetical protein
MFNNTSTMFNNDLRSLLITLWFRPYSVNSRMLHDTDILLWSCPPMILSSYETSYLLLMHLDSICKAYDTYTFLIAIISTLSRFLAVTHLEYNLPFEPNIKVNQLVSKDWLYNIIPYSYFPPIAILTIAYTYQLWFTLLVMSQYSYPFFISSHTTIAT